MAAVIGWIYCVLNTVNGKRYIGQTTQTVAVRWYQHCADAKARMYPLHCAIRKYGPDAFIVSELGRAASQDELNRMEIEFIAVHQSADRKYGYNVRAGGDSGGKLSAETRRKISERHAGRVAHNKGKPMPEHQRQLLIARLKVNHPCTGRVMSEETKAKIGAANRIHTLGSKQSAATKQKRSESLLRHYANPEARKQLSLARMGHAVSEMTKEKIGSAHKGKIVSPEARARIAIAVSELWADPQFRANQVAKRVGNKPTSEARAKQSAAMKRVWQARKGGIECQPVSASLQST